MAQNLCLALRAQGVATTFTTLLVAREPDVRELLGIPVGTWPRPATSSPGTRPARSRGGCTGPTRPQLAFADRYGSRLSAGEGAP